MNTKYDPIETAKRHLRDCMESPDYPVHNCYVTCNDVAYLLAEVERQNAFIDSIMPELTMMRTEHARSYAEVERLTGLLPTEGYIAIRAENDELRAEVARQTAARYRGREGSSAARGDRVGDWRQRSTLLSMAERKTCDAGCGRAWVVKFEWSYTTPERYCRECMLEAIDNDAPIPRTGPPHWTLLDYMPDCQQITVRTPGRLDRQLRSMTELQLEMLGRSGAPV